MLPNLLELRKSIAKNYAKNSLSPQFWRKRILPQGTQPIINGLKMNLGFETLNENLSLIINGKAKRRTQPFFRAVIWSLNHDLEVTG